MKLDSQAQVLDWPSAIAKWTKRFLRHKITITLLTAPFHTGQFDLFIFFKSFCRSWNQKKSLKFIFIIGSHNITWCTQFESQNHNEKNCSEKNSGRANGQCHTGWHENRAKKCVTDDETQKLGSQRVHLNATNTWTLLMMTTLTVCEQIVVSCSIPSFSEHFNEASVSAQPHMLLCDAVCSMIYRQSSCAMHTDTLTYMLKRKYCVDERIGRIAVSARCDCVRIKRRDQWAKAGGARKRNWTNNG